MTPAATLRDTRRNAGLTQQQLAERMGVRQPSVARLEADDADPRVSTLTRALNAAGYALVLHAMPQAPRPVDVDEGQIRELRRLTPAQRLDLFERNHANMTRFLLEVRGAA